MTHYETLNVAPTATSEEIKKAYRDMAKKKHPDAGGSKEEFQEISKAWMILRDPIKREHYDRTESDEPDKFEEMFRNLITGAFERSEYPIQALTDKLKRDAADLETQRSKAKVEHEIFLKRIKKFNRKNPNNDLMAILQYRSDVMEQGIKEFTLALDTIKKMQDRLKIYKEDKRSSSNHSTETTVDMMRALWSEILQSK